MRAVIVALLLVVLSASAARAAPLSAESQRQFNGTVQPFLKAHCIKCHNDKKTLAGFRIDTLGTDFLVDKTADHWKEIYDNLGLGKMPPEDEPRPEASQAAAVMDWIDQEIRNAERLLRNSAGRTRRLNRTEYFNTLRELFELDNDYVRSMEEELPPDAKVDGFDRVGASLYIDQSQLAKYLELVDRVLNQNVFAPQPKVSAPVKDFARDIKWDRDSDGGKLTTVDVLGMVGAILDKRQSRQMPTGATVYELKNGGIEYLCGGERISLGSHSSRSYGAGDGAGGGSWNGRVAYFLSQVTQAGKYRLKIRAGAFAGTGKFAVENVKLQFEFGKNGQQSNLDRATMIIDAPLDKPKDYVMEIYLHPQPNVVGGIKASLTWNGVPAYAQEYTRGQMIQRGLILVIPEIYTVASRLQSEHYARVAEEKKKGTPPDQINEILKSHFAAMDATQNQAIEDYVAAQKPVFVYNPDVDLAAIPRLFLESWEVEGPIVEWPSPAQRNLLFDGTERKLDSPYMREILARFLPQAYRRPVESAEIDSWVTWIADAQAEHKLSDLDAFKMGLKAILCSPGFLFIQEVTEGSSQPQKLTDYELASRLSYFLWSTMPDAELFKLAAENKLHEPPVLQSQVRRMIADPKAIGFVQNFAGQWLQVRDFGKTLTDRNLYKNYTEELRQASWQEPYAFFAEILGNDRSILNFLDSDFVVINAPLAKFYGIEGVKEVDGFKKVAIRPEVHRGGVIGMAGVLTYLTDGLRTLPVRRAAYVLDTLWNEPPKPPPPNAGDLPAVKGKNLTVRQRLEQHRDSAMCASCHTRLDPFGVALENFDAIGAWRDRQTGEGFRGDERSPPLDVSGTLPSGRKFHDLNEYKQALLAEKDRFVRGFTQKLLTYALGRSVGATDRDTIAGVVKAVEHNDYRMQALIQAIVASEVFQRK